MKALAQPEVMKAAAVAAAVSAVLCLPRFITAEKLAFPIWYLEALAFLGGMVLWGFVFAWQEPYSQTPVFRKHLDPRLLAGTTVAGILLSLLLHWFLDPALRRAYPREFPATFMQWVASALFNLGFTQLFVLFAPFAWLLRLLKKIEPAVMLTIIFSLFVFWIRNRNAPDPLPWNYYWPLLLMRGLSTAVGLFLLLRGGIVVVSWWTLLLHLRHLPGL